MAGTLCSLLMIVAVVCTVWVSPVQGEGGVCFYMILCSRDFNEQATQIGHDQDTFCRLKEKELDCFRGVWQQCPVEQRTFAQKQFNNAQEEHLRACDATWPLTSWLVLSVATILAVFNNCGFRLDGIISLGTDKSRASSMQVTKLAS